ncbi:MAG TPA: M14 family zinc carboxypeptidase, partial [Saprospiraceae bacterium]|nr:M14 family zinc carboxypeptidase [Saprospiraceae bacterium]
MKLGLLALPTAALLLSLLICPRPLLAQSEKPTLDYYLPALTYNPAIPTPAQYLGYEVGEWHVSHDQLVAYMRELDRLSDRIALKEYGRSHENRPLLCLFITSPANHSRLEEIRTERRRLADPAVSKRIDLAKLPAVNYMGYSIHGNEASGSNAALAVAYYLAAAQSPDVEQLLQNTVILFDPCFNPDGLQRFSSWVNSRRSRHGSHDPAADEFNEPWPMGRTNHYGFDLNRDWLVTQQPESVGRVALLQAWKPNVLTDHHEMGSGSTFFFQPGVPSRVNPITPARNQVLTAKIATYHAAALQDKQVQFFTGESFDDFYYGKGSTYPDANGCVGILFEQGSSRGSAQETDNGLLTFPYSIRNQVITSLSTLRAVQEMRVELNEYLREFYLSALDEARRDEMKGYVFADDRELPARSFLQLLSQHGIQVQNLGENATLDGYTYTRGSAFWVPLEQPQYRLVKGIFDRQTKFQDSVFYDISAWTLPDAFGLQWSAVRAKDYNPRWGDKDAMSLSSRYGTYMIG